jgi:hypothetical protein
MKGKKGYIYRIRLSDELLNQIKKDSKGFSKEAHFIHNKEFDKWDTAYNYGIMVFASLAVECYGVTMDIS